MEAKDKAKEIINMINFYNNVFLPPHEKAKKIALIACAEVRNNTFNDFFDLSSSCKNEEYWQDVENEINQL